jgi:REP element-mobilizing transposase RayT
MKKTYRINTTRLKGWDYGSEAAYFVTVNVRYRKHSFGEIKDGKMILSPLGQFVDESWRRTAIIRPKMDLILGAHVVMPDHFHALLTIGPNEFNQVHRVNRFGPQSNNLGAIMGGFKGSVTSFAEKNGIPFEWQKEYWDSIVRGSLGYLTVTRYIINNPKNWELKKKNARPPQ